MAQVISLRDHLLDWAASLARRARTQDGQGLIEYALILTLVTVGLIVIVGIIGKKDQNMWSNITNAFVAAGG